MNDELSLMTIMNTDPEFGKRLAKKVQEFKEDKQQLLNVADSYGERYKTEILEGTELRAKLLSEGSAKGLSEEQIMREYKGYIPTVYTPVLNLCYFLLRESNDDPYYGQNRYQNRDRIDEQHGSSVDELKKEKISMGYLENKEIKTDTLKDQPMMEEFLYGSLTIEEFLKIKKLKRLSINNSNKEEAFLAWRKANELCEKYNLDFNRIPS